MRLLQRCCVLGASAVLTVVSLGAAGIQSDRPMHVYWSCHTGQAGNPVHVTDVWEARALASEVRGGFLKLLADKYAYKGPLLCSMAEKLSPTGLAKHKEDQEQLYKHFGTQGLKIVRTGWTLAATGQSPVATPAAPATAASEFWSVCRASRLAPGGSVVNGPYDTYLSDVFPLSRAQLGYQTRPFADFLSTKYGRDRDIPQCNASQTEAGARVWLKAWADEGAKGGKVIMTGWKFTK